MKILRLTTLLDFGGQERKYISFTESKNLLNHQYVFGAIGYGGNAEKILRERGFEVHILNRNFSIRNLSNIWAVYQLIKKVKPDVVHTAAAEANFHGILAAKLAGVKYIIGEEIGIPNHSKNAQFIFRQIYKAAQQVICVSAAVKNHLVKIKEIPEEKGVVIYNPAESPDFIKHRITDQFNIVYVGRLEKVKNVEALIKAFSRIFQTNAILTLVGDGRERKNLENLARELKIEKNVQFVGFATDPHEYLQSADLFVLPSFSEGFGIAAVEAMLMRVPVLCSNVGGIPEFVEHEKTGWLFNPNNLEELSAKLKEVMEMDPTSLEEIGINGYKSVKEVFTKKKYVENLEKLYETRYEAKK
ncbi:glycosyltransferase family 4 protein [Moheibacter stercoris]|uniref:Glycosyltransferase involved in cell wall biosynthesis n=1 Tax=Moheibacter stercoris TaxID=1628251 RepID=A0ABV2LQ40_9FLAO